ncbi:MAG: hypothetical protein N2747_02665 [Chitinophagaceae bacterium]|nr:hypothetical protein [Chitinophagaceae bacterium]
MEYLKKNGDFEKFLKEKAEQYRMHPSEKVWEGIYRSLHRRKRNYTYGWIFLIVITSLLIWRNVSRRESFSHQFAIRLPDQQLHHISLNHFSENRTPGYSTNAVNTKTPVSTDDNIQNSTIVNTDFTRFDITKPRTIISDLSDAVNNPVEESSTEISSSVSTSDTGVQTAEASATFEEFKELPALEQFPQPEGLTASNHYYQLQSQTAHLLEEKMQNPEELHLSKTPTETPRTAFTEENNEQQISEQESLPFIPDRHQESIQVKSVKRAWIWQLYFTPTISYRTLAENSVNAYVTTSASMNAAGIMPYASDVNSMVYHRPDMGFQIGIKSAYVLSEKWNLTGGLQFSVSKYDIKAFQHPDEVATITLRDRNVSTISRFRNTNGIKENWLRNFYFSAGIPIGVEKKFSENKKNFIGMGASLQPTFVIDNRAYLISSDYKNYAEMPSLIRRMNVNSSVEIFTQQQTGKIRWRVGPQVRYQLFSSFLKKYPINEHLFDFGIKMGVQLNK